jgi:mono/diheme cytochrome c family protein
MLRIELIALSVVLAGLGSLLTGCGRGDSGAHMMGGGMMGGGMMGQMPPGISKQSLPEQQSEGARLFRSYCGQCHALPAPTAHTARDWPQVMMRMKQRMVTQGKAVPDRDQLQVISAYLQRNAE